MALTVCDVLYLYSSARAAYERFIGVGGNPEQARNAVALLAWLEQWDVPVIHHVPGLSPTAVNLVVAEAGSILECLREQDPVLPAIPLISALCRGVGCVDPRFFAFHQDLVVRGVAASSTASAPSSSTTACTVVNNPDLVRLRWRVDLWETPNMHLLLRRYQTGLVGNPPALSAPYNCRPVAVPEHCRSMFVTFSKGMPIDAGEIFDYFSQKWGDCVVRVLMEEIAGGTSPLYGRIVFRTEALVRLVLNGERLVKITIGHRQIWLRKYVPRPANI